VKGFGRRARDGEPPSEVVAAAVPRGERVLASAHAVDGTWLLATRERLSAVRGNEVVRLRWEEVHRAEWDRDTATLTVEPVRDYGQPVASTAYQVEEPGPLLAFVRERVDASVLLQRKVAVIGKRGFTVVARRPPTGRGELTWSFEFDPGIDPDDAVVAAATDLALGEAKESLGL
jgi:hypothetical protein